MILVCVGTQLPFDRLVSTVDSWAEGKDVDIFGQIGATDLVPNHMKYASFLDEKNFNQLLSEASLIVSHAGMGTIISALTLGKPIIVLPRLEQYGEHRNDHQLSTVRKLPSFANLHIAESSKKLLQLLDSNTSYSGSTLSDQASNELLETLDKFISEI